MTIDIDPKPKPKRRGGPGARRDTLFKPANPYAFKKGQSGNPKGRAKGTGTKLVQAYSVQLGDRCTLPGLEHHTWAEAISRALVERAASGDVRAAKELREATEGRAPKFHEVKADDGAPPAAPSLIVNDVKGPSERVPPPTPPLEVVAHKK